MDSTPLNSTSTQPLPSLILKDQSTQTGKTLNNFYNNSNQLTHSLSDNIKPIQAQQHKRIVLPDIRRCRNKMKCSYLFESKTLDNDINSCTNNNNNVGALKIIGRGIKKEGDKFVFRNKALRPLEEKVKVGLRLNLGVLSPIQKGRIKKFMVNFNRFASFDV